MKSLLMLIIYGYLILGAIFVFVFWVIPNMIKALKNLVAAKRTKTTDPEKDEAYLNRIVKEREAEEKEASRKHHLKLHDKDSDPILAQ